MLLAGSSFQFNSSRTPPHSNTVSHAGVTDQHLDKFYDTSIKYFTQCGPGFDWRLGIPELTSGRGISLISFGQLRLIKHSSCPSVRTCILYYSEWIRDVRSASTNPDQLTFLVKM